MEIGVTTAKLGVINGRSDWRWYNDTRSGV